MCKSVCKITNNNLFLQTFPFKYYSDGVLLCIFSVLVYGKLVNILAKNTFFQIIVVILHPRSLYHFPHL